MSPDLLRRKVLSEWRGLDEPKSRAERCASVSDLLQKVMPKLGLGERLGEQQVTAAWREVVGDFLALHSLPVGQYPAGNLIYLELNKRSAWRVSMARILP